MALVDASFGFNNPTYSDHMLTIIHITSKHITKEKIYVNRLLLAASSPYFKAQFDSGMLECKKHNTVIQLDDDEDHFLFKELIRFIYNKQLKSYRISELFLLYKMADRLRILVAMNEYYKVLSEVTMSTKIACEFMSLPEQYYNITGIKTLYRKGVTYLAKNFNECCQHCELMALDERGIANIITCTELDADTHNIVYQFIVKWYLVDEKFSDFATLRLLQLVKYSKLTKDFIMNVIFDDYRLQKLQFGFKPINHLIQDAFPEIETQEILYHPIQTPGLSFIVNISAYSVVESHTSSSIFFLSWLCVVFKLSFIKSWN